MRRILDYLKKVLGERRYNESVMKGGRYSVICIALPDKVLAIKDKFNGRVIEVELKNIGSSNWQVRCMGCKSSNCDHVVFAIYSPYISILRDLYFEEENQILQLPLRIYEMITNRLSFDPMKILPVVALLIIGMGLIPIQYDPTIDTFRIFLSGLLGLNPLVNVGVPI